MGRGVRKPLRGFVLYLFYVILFYFVLISKTEFKIEAISSLWSSLADWLTKTKIGRRTKQAHHAMIPVVFHFEKFPPPFLLVSCVHLYFSTFLYFIHISNFAKTTTMSGNTECLWFLAGFGGQLGGQQNVLDSSLYNNAVQTLYSASKCDNKWGCWVLSRGNTQNLGWLRSLRARKKT